MTDLLVRPASEARSEKPMVIGFDGEVEEREVVRMHWL